MNLKTLYELKEVLDFCGYHDTIVEDMTNRGIDLESLEDKVNHGTMSRFRTTKI